MQIRWRRRHWLCKEKLAVLLISISFPLRRWNHLQGDVLHPKCCDNINANITGGPLLSTFPYIKQHFSHLIASRLSFWPLLQKLNTRNCKKNLWGTAWRGEVGDLIKCLQLQQLTQLNIFWGSASPRAESLLVTVCICKILTINKLLRFITLKQYDQTASK